MDSSRSQFLGCSLLEQTTTNKSETEKNDKFRQRSFWTSEVRLRSIISRFSTHSLQCSPCDDRTLIITTLSQFESRLIAIYRSYSVMMITSFFSQWHRRRFQLHISTGSAALVWHVIWNRLSKFRQCITKSPVVSFQLVLHFLIDIFNC